MPTLHVVAGPNGCGKSTLTRTRGFSGLDIIDPDEIARSMVPGSPGRAAREALRRRRDALNDGRTHVVETTLAGAGILRHMEATRKAGYRVFLHYVFIGSPAQALYRIRSRVALGGHDVPKHDVLRRFERSRTNLSAAVARADEVYLYDNAEPDRPHLEVAAFRGETLWVVEAVPDWAIAALVRGLDSTD